ncbi:hypothetical protein [Roseicyclus marinus]|uniref:hypothetical protein n=1 Tax=Roseicyclus marinus TaxID=2161673 RepID=UPI00240FB27E|nr:hypothetical protein [Roseicyclus marinus]MDG3039810.1 hypothetical protein [Roseicyclus marinus]
MPTRIETIDMIARRLGRDVIFLDIRSNDRYAVLTAPEVVKATAWLEAEGIGWTDCIGFVPKMLLIEGGPRAIYIDISFEPGSEMLAQLEARFETPDGHPRDPDLILAHLTLEDALINEGQDAPEFWDNI